MIEEYEYVKVNMTPEEIAHAMINGEKFYSHGGEFSFYWNSSSGFINNKGANITLRGSFYKRIKNKENSIKDNIVTEEYEYVKVEGSIFDLKDDFEAGNLYFKDSNLNGVFYIECKTEVELIDAWDSVSLYKRIKKERKFNEGEWYPCVDKYDERSVYMYSNGRFFIDEFTLSSEFDVLSMKWIGESLGEIKFGDNDLQSSSRPI